jgi:hypothetical protein
VALRNYMLMKLAARIPTASTATWRDTFLKTQNIINNFMRHKPTRLVKAVGDEAYPLADKIDPTKLTTIAGQLRANRSKAAAKRQAKHR